MSKQDFFIGWSDEMPQRDRRFFLRAGIGLSLGTVGLAAGLGALQEAPNTGRWTMGDVREWRGCVTDHPYAMLRTRDLDGTPRTALLACQGKCGVSARIRSYAGRPVVVRGSLIARDKYAMIAVTDEANWIEAAPNIDIDELLFPQPQDLGQMTLKGAILDSKCWFGAMSPAEGKVHKACASLCIRGGIPPAFFVKDRREQTALLLMTNSGGAHDQTLLPFVADPVEMTGDIKRWGDLFLFDGPVTNLRRL